MQESLRPAQVIRFGVFEADLRAGELRKSGVKLKLHGQPFDVLALLLEHPGEVVTREELQRRLWPGDTFVDFDNSLNAAINKLREALGDSADNPRFVETLPRRGYRFLYPAEQPAAPEAWRTEATEASVAVLPFVDISPQKDQEYFCDGMTEEIISALTKVDGLYVVSRTSVFQFKGKVEDIRKIGEQLSVRTVVEGSVRKAGDKLRITAQLTNVADGYHLWSQGYDRKLQDVFAIQDEISGAIVKALKERLKWKLAKEKGPRLVLSKPSYTGNLKAYDLFLKGRYFWNQRNEAGVKRSIEYFQQVLEKDPNYALAYVGLANSYSALAAWEEDAVSRARLYGMSQDLIDRYIALVIPQ